MTMRINSINTANSPSFGGFFATVEKNASPYDIARARKINAASLAIYKKAGPIKKLLFILLPCEIRI